LNKNHNSLKKNKISLIVPIYNEDQHLLRFIAKLDTLELQIEKELIFIDDNSSDNSYSILKNYKFKSKVITFHQPSISYKFFKHDIIKNIELKSNRFGFEL
jgi:glycosyltransferase involved in cell wall biosynthesis